MSSDSPLETTLMISGMAVGGTVISLIGSAAHYISEKELPKTKAIFRDFIIGAILVLLLLQLVPNSVSSVISLLPSFKTILSGGGEVLEQAADMHIQTGVPGF